MLRLLTQIVQWDLYIVDLRLNASDECTLAGNRYKTFPYCKGEPLRQILGRIPPHTHLQVWPSLCETPHMVEWMPNDVCDIHTLHAQRLMFMHIHNGIKTICLELYTFHILKRMSGNANQLAVHFLVFNSSYYI